MSYDYYNTDSNDHSDESDVEYEFDQLVKLGCGAVMHHFVMHMVQKCVENGGRPLEMCPEWHTTDGVKEGCVSCIFVKVEEKLAFSCG
uniref:Uncharacterized protein n=1 Tax=Cucumis melo TaxID=3656 RepID=A0A9I9DMH1_CUCME